MDINFELYKVFYHVANSLSFSQASERLHITQSAVSQSIKLLEKNLDCKLFFRNPKKVFLTQEGKILFKHIEQAFNLIKNGERNISAIKKLQLGEIRIGASDTISKYYLLPYFQQFTKLYPQIKIHLINRPSPVCIELLKKGMIDVGFINIPEDFSSNNINVKRIKTLQDVFIAGKNFIELKDRKVELEELINYPFLMLEKKSTTRIFFDSFLQKYGLTVIPEIELGSLDLVIELTKIGLGISFVTEDIIKNNLNDAEIFTINLKQKIPQRYLGIIFSTKIPLPAAAEKFIELLDTNSL